MPIYEWVCHECTLVWDRDCEIGKAPKKTLGPECKKRSERYFGGLSFSFKDDGCWNTRSGAMDFRAVRGRYYKHIEKGYDKDSADRFLNRSIRQTTERITDEKARYKPMHLNYENMARDGVVRKLDSKESLAKQERAKKLTQDAYNKANKSGYDLDITKPQKQQ